MVIVKGRRKPSFFIIHLHIYKRKIIKTNFNKSIDKTNQINYNKRVR
jgi:hypothetical protein